MLSPRALSDRRDLGLAGPITSVTPADDIGRDDLLLVSRMSDMLGHSVKLSTDRSRPADADPARGATLGDEA